MYYSLDETRAYVNDGERQLPVGHWPTNRSQLISWIFFYLPAIRLQQRTNCFEFRFFFLSPPIQTPNSCKYSAGRKKNKESKWMEKKVRARTNYIERKIIIYDSFELN